MAHNIFGNRFYGDRQPAWHGLGIVSEDKLAVDALTMLGGGYWFEKRPVQIFMNGKMVEVGDYALVRSPVPDDPTERNFGYATKNYNVIQPLRVCELFDEKVNVPVETLGMLGKGEKLFLTWKMPGFDVKGDDIQTYGFVACGYDAKYGVTLNVVTTRVVCQNTWNIAVSEAENTKEEGRGKIWVGKHNSNNIERDLGIWMEHIQQRAEMQCNLVKSLFGKMAEVPMDKDNAYSLLFQVYPIADSIPENYPQKLKLEKETRNDEITLKAEQSADAVMSLFQGEGTAIDATAWGLFNAVTEYENWGRPSKKAPEYSIMLGNRNNTMNRAAKVIGNYCDTLNQ